MKLIILVLSLFIYTSVYAGGDSELVDVDNDDPCMVEADVVYKVEEFLKINEFYASKGMTSIERSGEYTYVVTSISAYNPNRIAMRSALVAIKMESGKCTIDGDIRPSSAGSD